MEAPEMERNKDLERVAGIFVGDWTVTITNQWWLDDPSTVTTGQATCEWLGDAFLSMQAEIDGTRRETSCSDAATRAISSSGRP